MFKFPDFSRTFSTDGYSTDGFYLSVKDHNLLIISFELEKSKFYESREQREMSPETFVEKVFKEKIIKEKNIIEKNYRHVLI